MTFKHGAIPTEYKGIQFRSRTEARWAAFFDEMRWKWEYEPYDLNGWIPDFELNAGKKRLVEVKPSSTNSELRPFAKSQQLSRCPDGTLLLGSHPLWHCGPDEDECVLGIDIQAFDWILESASSEEEGLFNSYHKLHVARHGYSTEPDMGAFSRTHQIPWGRTVQTDPEMVALCECGRIVIGFSCLCGNWRRELRSGAAATRIIREAWAHAQNATQWKGSRR